jgi:hypothetical protein
MARISWGTPGEKFYEAGVDRGVLYVDSAGVVWNGLSSVQESASGGDPQPYYLDGYKYVQLAATEDFQATIEAYSSPREFGPCDGSTELYSGLTVTQQKRKQFSLSYRSKVGDDISGLDLGYKIHLVYNALAAPSDRDHKTIGDGVDLTTLSWAISTQPPTATGFRPTSHFIVDTRRTTSGRITTLEDILYGTVSTSPRFPTVTELLAIMA